ncbi:MAG: UDP-N-acetylmuramoyl-tripeptide--D-alanyl-D-alanine ligase, partial [Halioglobus sp.]|nr:UDP-N-acetylmuramoyl-tripeptide--D-alanyl-D-alanine ligase [Halioglobus sp.]
IMMRPLALSELRLPLEGQLYGTDCDILGVSTDSRSLRAGDLFVALRGDQFDGQQYVQEVSAAGAVAAIVRETVVSSLPQLQVADTQRALGLLGAYNRQQYSGTLVGITGSSGKTTVKNMVHAVLSQRGDTLATKGNFNNEIGVPLTLLRLRPGIEFAVVEMGAAKPGDIAWLCELACPTVALLLNAMPAHLEGLGTVEGVAAAKGEIFDRLVTTDVAIINADQPWSRQWRKRAAAATIIDFGLEQPASISARNIQGMGVRGISFTVSTPIGDMSMRLNLPGVHNVANALAAVAVGLACELSLADIRDGLESLEPSGGRLRSMLSPSGAAIIDDCYNANPGSVRAAIDMLATCSGQRTLVLGAMRELGRGSREFHKEVGAYAFDAGIEQLWGVGPELEVCVEAFGARGRFFADRAAALVDIEGQFGEDDTVLVKGSRSAGMERVLHALLPHKKSQEH